MKKSKTKIKKSRINVQLQIGQRYLRGGLGDAYWYLFHDPIITRLNNIFEKHPELKINIVHYTHTKTSTDLFIHPQISSIKQVYTKEEEKDVYIKNSLQKYLNNLNEYKQSVFKPYLDNSDREFLAELIKKPYILCHFQAGGIDREVLNPTEQYELLEKITNDNPDKNIYFIGTKSDLKICLPENVIDLRGKTNPRILFYLAEQSDNVFCYHSFMLLLCAYLNKKVTCYYPAYHIEIEKERLRFEKFFNILLSSNNITLIPIAGLLSNYNEYKNIGNDRFILSYGASPVSSSGMGKLSREIIGRVSSSGFRVNHIGIGYEPLHTALGTQFPNPLPFDITSSSHYNEYLSKKGLAQDTRGRPLLFNTILSNKPSIVWINEDLFRLYEAGFHKFLDQHKENIPNTKLMVYFPIDSENYSANWLTVLDNVDYPITFTKWGTKKAIELKPDLKDRLLTIPHGMDFNILYNYDDENYINKLKEEKVGSSDKFIFLTVAENQARKDFPTQLIAFKKFLDQLPKEESDKCVMLIVGTKKSQFGWHIDNIINRIGLSPDQVLVPTNFPLNDHDLRDTYNIADVGVTAAFAEGWGYFVTECMATKTPVIAGRHTSNHDFIVDGENGFFVELEDRPYYLHGMVDDPPRYFLQIDDLVNKMMLLYKMKKEQRKEIGENGYKTVKQYEWNLVWQQWEGLFSVI